jgi:hypothetical protein
MFHNGGYANCDVALPTIAISMGYSANQRSAPAQRDYANLCLVGARGVHRGGVASRMEDPATAAPGGKIRAPIRPLVTHARAFPPNGRGGRKILRLEILGGFDADGF